MEFQIPIYNECDSETDSECELEPIEHHLCSCCNQIVHKIKPNTWRNCCIQCSKFMQSRDCIRSLIVRLCALVDDLRKEELEVEYELFRRMNCYRKE